jgi:uncharacterized phage protein (TIGR02216 family)
MAAGLGQLRLPPEAFWAATPREIAAAFATTGRDTLSRNHLDDLLRRYPDEP